MKLVLKFYLISCRDGLPLNSQNTYNLCLHKKNSLDWVLTIFVLEFLALFIIQILIQTLHPSIFHSLVLVMAPKLLTVAGSNYCYNQALWCNWKGGSQSGMKLADLRQLLTW